MTNEQKHELIHKLKRVRPFKPFAIVAKDGNRAVIDWPLGCASDLEEVVLQHPQTKKVWHLPLSEVTAVEENPSVSP
jgi:hypothetical protein